MHHLVQAPAFVLVPYSLGSALPDKPPQWTLLEKLEHAGLGKCTTLATNGEKED